ncbi:hypothetical protein Vi05172_g163 [Venturia inaequalis]|nr:hypothetical protein Vi05172_g163 [Venturia inaequalis]
MVQRVVTIATEHPDGSRGINTSEFELSFDETFRHSFDNPDETPYVSGMFLFIYLLAATFYLNNNTYFSLVRSAAG